MYLAHKFRPAIGPVPPSKFLGLFSLVLAILLALAFLFFLFRLLDQQLEPPGPVDEPSRAFLLNHPRPVMPGLRT